MGKQQISNCFICFAKVTSHRHTAHNCREYECEHCGRYYLSDDLKGESSWIRPMMFYFLRHETKGKLIFFVKIEPADKTDYADYADDAWFVTKTELEGMRPKNLNEKVDMIMLNLGACIKFWGDRVVFGFSGRAEEARLTRTQSALLLFCGNIYNYHRTKTTYAEIRGTLKFLVDYGYIELEGDRHDDLFTVSFTVDGWKRLGELQSMKHELPQAFIAMHFSPDMADARESIKRAITDSGYIPVIIDEKEHNKQIVPEIFYEIQKSKFLIADLTGHRNGVYYEAGFAQGMGKEVILTCRESDFKERHFDVAQISTIVWCDANDLYVRLLRRIEATVGKRA